MTRKRHKLSIVLMAVGLVIFLCSTTPVLAALADPDDVTLHTAKVFQDVFESDDMLFVVSYDVAYASEPSESAAATFQMSIYDTDGSTLIQARSLKYYQYNVYSIYFDADAAASLTWESEYVVRVMGNPIFFPMTEDVTMDTYALSSFSWVEGSAATTSVLLGQHCLDLAEDLEIAWEISLITSTPEREVLNSTGRLVFLDAIPGLDSAAPNLFQMASTDVDVVWSEVTGAYEHETSISSHLGTSAEAAFAGIGGYLNVSGQMVAAMWIVLFAVVVASIVFLNSGNTVAAMILTIPIFLIGTWVGAIPMALLFTVAIIIVVYMMYHVWLRGM